MILLPTSLTATMRTLDLALSKKFPVLMEIIFLPLKIAMFMNPAQANELSKIGISLKKSCPV